MAHRQLRCCVLHCPAGTQRTRIFDNVAVYCNYPCSDGGDVDRPSAHGIGQIDPNDNKKKKKTRETTVSWVRKQTTCFSFWSGHDKCSDDDGGGGGGLIGSEETRKLHTNDGYRQRMVFVFFASVAEVWPATRIDQRPLRDRERVRYSYPAGRVTTTAERCRRALPKRERGGGGSGVSTHGTTVGQASVPLVGGREST